MVYMRVFNAPLRVSLKSVTDLVTWGPVAGPGDFLWHSFGLPGLMEGNRSELPWEFTGALAEQVMALGWRSGEEVGSAALFLWAWHGSFLKPLPLSTYTVVFSQKFFCLSPGGVSNCLWERRELEETETGWLFLVWNPESHPNGKPGGLMVSDKGYGGAYTVSF